MDDTLYYNVEFFSSVGNSFWGGNFKSVAFLAALATI